MQKIFDHFKTNAGVWTFGLFMAAVAGGIYQFTVFMVSAQVTPLKVLLDAQVERLDAADGNTNDAIGRLEKQMNARFDLLQEAIGQNTDKIILLDRKIENKIDLLNNKIDRKITMLDQKIDRQIGLLDQKIEKKFDQLDKKISRLDEKMDKKFNLILLRLPPLKK